MSLSGKVRKALYTALNVSSVTDLATNGVWHAVAPAGTAPPIVVYNRLTVEEIYRTFGRGYEAESMVYHVKSHCDKASIVTAGDTVSDHNERVLDACESAIGNTLALSGGSETLNVERSQDLPEIPQKFENRDVLVASFLLTVVAT